MSDPFSHLFQALNLYAADKYAREIAALAASTAPWWRTVSIPASYGFAQTAEGTSLAATAAGAGALAAAALPIITMVGAWAMIGGAYAEGRRIAGERGALSGFSQGFVMGVLNWQWGTAAMLFGKWQAGRNAFDQGAARAEAESYNKGLVAGYALGSGAPDIVKKAYRIKLRKLANSHVAGSWSNDADEAYLQQTNYVISLAAAGVNSGLIKP